MAEPTHDIKKLVGLNRPQTARRVEWPWRLDFSLHPVEADEDAEALILPAGFMFERLDAVLRVPEGTAATMHVGIEGTATLFAASLNMNGSANQRIANVTSQVAVTSPDAATQGGSYAQADVQSIATLANELKGDVNALAADLNFAGRYFHTDTPVRVSVPSGAATLDDAVVDLIFVGYMIDVG